MKYEWRKEEKHFLPKRVEIKTIPSGNYLSIDGQGNPGGEDFKGCVQALYAVSYAIKMTLKNNENFYDYTVYPLEGIWSLSEEGIRRQNEGASIEQLKDYFIFTMRIKQPDFVTVELFEQFRDSVYNKKKYVHVNKLYYKFHDEEEVCQTMHIGLYDEEPATFELMEDFCLDKGYRRISKNHIEVYISDPSRVAPEKLKTTLRFKVDK